MKIFKLKYIVMLISASLLWSCQTEQAFSEAVTSTKKVPLPDGIPSAADDQYEFAKSTYYHGDTVITDTLLIKQMLATANGLHIDVTGYKKQIFVTEQERIAFDAATENNADRSTTVLDGDNYLHYFFEINAQDRYRDYKTIRYINIVGFRDYDTNGGFEMHTYNQVSTRTPESAGFGTVTSQSLEDYMYTNGSNNNLDNFTDINVINTTRFTRRVVFVATDDRRVTRDIATKGRFVLRASKTFVGSQTYSYFNGLAGFRARAHRSVKL